MEDLDTWKAHRLAALTAPDGWLNLVARIDTGPGRWSVGAGPGCDLVLPSGPDGLGWLQIGPEGATFTGADGAARPFQPGAGGFPILSAAPFLLEIHTVDGVPALRVRDLRLRPDITLRHFPPAPGWIIRADWQETPPQPMTIRQKGGSTAQVVATHVARFRHGGHDVALTPTHWKGGQPMFVIRDATAGQETYGAARFLMGEEIGGGAITLDFNRAFNPPCAFTDFAICPLPPPGNILPFRVEAGERAP